MMDDGIFYLVGAYVLVSTVFQAMRLAALHSIGRRLGVISLGVQRVGDLLEQQGDLDIEVELEETQREYASTA